MSRAGTPTDNRAMEAINGWIKTELFMDFHITGEKPMETEIRVQNMLTSTKENATPCMARSVHTIFTKKLALTS